METVQNVKRKRITALMIAGTVLLLLIGAFIITVQLLGVGKMSVVTTNSMSPAVPKGSLIFTVTTNPSDIQAGDIITLSSQNNADLIVSRVESMSTSNQGVYSYTLREDNSFTPDPWLHKTNGDLQEVVTIIPVLGWLVLVLSHPVGGVFIVMLTLALAYMYTMRLYEYNRRMVRARQEALRRLELMSFGGVEEVIELFGEENIVILNDDNRRVNSQELEEVAVAAPGKNEEEETSVTDKA